jgi:hypothetical protein
MTNDEKYELAHTYFFGGFKDPEEDTFQCSGKSYHLSRIAKWPLAVYVAYLKWRKEHPDEI